MPVPEPLLPHAPATRSYRTLEHPAIVRTRGGHRFRPRVQTRAPARDGRGTSKAAADLFPTQGAEAPPALSHTIAMMQSPAAQSLAQSLPQLSLASRIRRPLFHCDLIPRNVDCRAKDFMESPIMIYQHWQRTHGYEILCGWSTGILCCHL